MNRFKENWFKLSVLLILLAALSVNSCFVVSSLAQQKVNNDLEKNVNLQTKCADMAAKYFTNNNYKNANGITFTYQNHLNSKLNKCFILITSYGTDNFLSIDLYDALESKHYAEYIGHSVCDTTILTTINEPKRCQLDSGNIWLDGNDTKNPADYHVGFGGLMYGGVGDENTQKQFMLHIQPFMND